VQSRIIGPTLAAVAIVVLAACGGNAAASLAPGIASNALPSAAAPSEAASTAASEAPSEAPSEAAASGAAVIPSFAYPSSDKELEALIPDKVCGATAIKVSFSGATFAATGDAELKALLAALGKSPADVSMAVAAAPGTGKCAAGIFRVKGADPSRLQQVFQAEAAKSGDVYVVKSIGGKDVYVATGGSDSSLQYAYIAGDALIFVAADTEAQAAELIAALP
jgi:hypothetical protein